MKKFVICLDNGSNPESLIVGKVYLTLPDENAANAGLIRVLDDNTEEQ